MIAEEQKVFCLLDELETSRKLICAGFGHLQEIDMGNDFYHLPHQLLASGLERLMKCYLALAYEDRIGTFPDQSWFQGQGHDLIRLSDLICEKYYGGINRPLIKAEHNFLKTDKIFRETLRILSLFGKFGRYYNLDVVGGTSKTVINPQHEWENLESSLEDRTPYVGNLESLYHDYFPRIHAKLVARLERFVRAISLQFTVGDHPDRFGRLRQASGIYSSFRNIRDEELGMQDYRQSVRIRQQRIKSEWVKRDQRQIARDGWPAQALEKAQADFEWPFRVSRVIIECRQQLFCLVNIEQYDFALNGAAISRFNLPTPHDAGIAVLGKSIGPLIDMAFSLRSPLEST